jgi:hypothetical protein
MVQFIRHIDRNDILLEKTFTNQMRTKKPNCQFPEPHFHLLFRDHSPRAEFTLSELKVKDNFEASFVMEDDDLELEPCLSCTHFSANSEI